MSLPANTASKEGDEALMMAVAVGDRRALEELYLGYYRRLARFLSRFTGFENAEEIINDTFMVVWQGAKDFRFDSQVSTWIFGIAYRTTLKSLRRQKSHAALRSLDSCPEPFTDQTQETEIKDWLSDGLSRLPLDQRLPLELAYHLGHSMEEVAAIIGAPVGTVKARLFHAREKLRRNLPVLGGGPGYW